MGAKYWIGKKFGSTRKLVNKKESATMNKKLQIFIFIFLIAALAVFILPQEVKAQRWCNLCAMDLQKYYRTKYILALEDGSKKYTCSIHCAAIIIKGKKVRKIESADYITGKMMDAGKAYYLTGSDIRGVMSITSKLAFAKKAEALTFQKEHGGELTDFNGALKAVESDMAQDMKMLKQKVKKMIKLGKVVAEANSCFACHGTDGKGGIINPGSAAGYVPAWDTIEFAENIRSKAQLKNMISKGFNKKVANKNNGALKMPAWKNFIKGKEMHALVNYVWSLRQNKEK